MSYNSRAHSMAMFRQLQAEEQPSQLEYIFDDKVARELKIKREVITQTRIAARHRMPSYLVKALDNLSLPDPTSAKPIDIGILKRIVPKAKDKRVWDPDMGSKLLANIDNDKELQVVCPPRTKSDVAIRRSRLSDTLSLYIRQGQVSELHNIAGAFAYDYITLCNMLNAHSILRPNVGVWSWFDFWNTLGAFDGDLTHYVSVCKFVNDLVKSRRVVGFDRMWIAESAVMVGFRNLPFPGFDKVVETKSLASKGGEHGLFGSEEERLQAFTAVAERALMRDPDPCPWVGFDSWVMSGDWETAGSSNVGKVEWSSPEGSGHFKARKNMVGDVTDLYAQAKLARESSAMINTAIVKSELGKVRMAVASDIYTYWKMAWISQYMSKAYLDWEGSTVAEDNEEQTKRIYDMLQRIRHKYNLPFDYAAFDHQPTTAEIVCIARIVIAIGRKNIGAENLEEYNAIADNVIRGFENATIRVTEDGLIHVFNVEGGCQSGWFWTTIIGNAWNTVMTAWSRQLLGVLIGHDPVVALWLRGDDSAIVADNYLDVLMMRWGYASIGAVGGEGKFGIHLSATEFLRVWYDGEKQRTFGYVTRAIPALVQRKPWTASPWHSEGVIMALSDSVRILKRRLGANTMGVDAWWENFCSRWSTRKHTSQNWLRLPRELGGLGVLPWKGSTNGGTTWAKDTARGVLITNLNDWRTHRIIEWAAELGYSVSHESARDLAMEQANERLSSDDVPQIAQVLRMQHKDPAPVKWMAIGQDIPNSMVAALITECTRLGVLTVDASLRTEARVEIGHYSRWQRLSPVLRDYKLLEKLGSLAKPFAVLFDENPDFTSDYKKAVRRGHSRRETIDWLFGESPLGDMATLHPSLTGIVRASTARLLNPYFFALNTTGPGWTFVIHQCAHACATSLAASEFATGLYGW